MIDLDKMKSAALAATQGEWESGEDNDGWYVALDNEQIGYAISEENAAYLSAANPSAVLELIERLEASEAILAKMDQAEPVAEVDEDDDNQWADILPNVNVRVGDKLYTNPLPAKPGWKLVPIIPTEEMIDAGKNTFCDSGDLSDEAATNDYTNVYKAMLAAAPENE